MKTLSGFIVALLGTGLLLGCVAGILAVPTSGTTSTGEVRTVYKSGLLEGLSYEELLEKAPVVVLGHIDDISDSFMIKPVNGGDPSVFTDRIVLVDAVYRGDVAAGDKLSVRVEGGKMGNKEVIVEEAPSLKLGDQKLLFLYQPNIGGAYNTEGDYYYVLGVNQGLFDVERTSDAPLFTSQYYATVSSEQLQKDLDIVAASGDIPAFNPNQEYDEFIENQKRNLENGFITQEEFEAMERAKHTYASIVK